MSEETGAIATLEAGAAPEAEEVDGNAAGTARGTAGGPIDEPPSRGYRLHEQIGFLLRQAMQRHTAIFAARMPHDLTPMQFAALARLCEVGATSQNELGRLTAMDVATIKGVVDRLRARGLVTCTRDPGDRRRIVVDLTATGHALMEEAVRAGFEITAETAAPLTNREAAELCRLLGKIG